ncbi:RHS repeat protein [Betaproteobacteria bacterium PRO7]|nr:RHS repeat protein [Betaproteobacteria bacterium PRO7]
MSAAMNLFMYRGRSSTFHFASRWAGLLLVVSTTCAFAQQQVTVRTSEFVYDAATGQLRIERIQPNNGAQPSPAATPNDCVETEYTLDPATGNRTAVTTRNCSGASPTGDHVFASRTTQFHFEARGEDSDSVSTLHGAAVPGPNDHAAGPFETRAVNALGHTEHKHYDVRFGVVARLVGPNGLPTTWTYDDYGRRIEERRADDTRTETRYFTCTWSTNPADPAPAPQPARAGGAAAIRPCLNFSETISVLFDSGRFTDASGTPSQSVQALAQTAYFIESVPRAPDGSQNGPISVVHFDALNREIAKETQSYDGRWVRTISAYDGLGLVAATYAAHFVSDSDLAPVRQITRGRDLRHRPTIHEFVAVEGQAAVQASMTYNGLETRATDPAGRTTITRKNAAGQTAQTVDAYLATLDMAYDAKGNLVRTRDALGIETAVTYNVRGFKLALADPDKGTWAYRYNALGELVWQESPNQRAAGQATTMRYDRLGRLIERDEASQRARWVYDTAPNGIGKLAETFTLLVDGTTRDFQQSLAYDTRGRASSTTTTIDRAYAASVTYDTRTGRVATQRYPTGFTLLYQYNALGFVQRVRDNADASRVYWSVDSLGGAHPFDARGNLVRQRLGDPTNPGGVQTFDVYDRASGKARQLRAGIADGSFATQNATYTYDRLTGNLVERFEATTNLRETFGYDTIDRLLSHTLSNTGVPAANRTITVRYNAIGNILWKSDVGVYTYGALGGARPHAVVNAAGLDYLYDANGNLASTAGAVSRTHEWASFDAREDGSGRPAHRVEVRPAAPARRDHHDPRQPHPHPVPGASGCARRAVF